ncbi:MAG: hypothetical protein IT238_09095 [Bacteroidia bacterium]|nr:hypothetical protein [Bacteroidia bacterium]
MPLPCLPIYYQYIISVNGLGIRLILLAFEFSVSQQNEQDIRTPENLQYLRQNLLKKFLKEFSFYFSLPPRHL